MVRPRSNQIRIIGGKWRSRRIRFPSIKGLRPTTDRMRETLFNKLRESITGAICLDLFAGSGVLGLEALSRGATHVTFVDHSWPVIKYLHANLALLRATQEADVYRLIIPKHPPPFQRKFDLVFLDPPYNLGLIEPAIDWLKQHRLLAKGALLYIESESCQKIISETSI